jgi:ABC-2 type transport system permease protein
VTPSSAFVRIDSMPGPVQAFAHSQPVTAVVDALRSQLVGGTASV